MPTATSPCVVVVGAGQSGVTLAATMRQLGHTGPLTVLGDEAREPYERPPLSKEFLAGTKAPDALALLPPASWSQLDVALVTGDAAIELDLHDQVVTTATGRRLPYDRLALATGARARHLSVPGADADGVVVLREVAHSERLARGLVRGARLVVVGGGFLGLEAASVARSLGAEVTVIELADRLLSRVAAPVLSQFIAAAHRATGVDVRLGRSVTQVLAGHGRVTGVLLDDGTRLPADLVLVAVGIAPRDELAAAAGLATGDGVVVDDLARVSVAVVSDEPGVGREDVVAVGDCARLPSPMGDGVLVRLESVQHAVDHARAGASTLLGQGRPYRAVPRFWSEQAGLRLQTAGLSAGYDATVVRGHPVLPADGTAASFSVAYLRAGRLLALDVVGRPREFTAARKALVRGEIRPDPVALADDTLPLMDVLA